MTENLEQYCMWRELMKIELSSSGIDMRVGARRFIPNEDKPSASTRGSKARKCVGCEYKTREQAKAGECLKYETEK